MKHLEKYHLNNIFNGTSGTTKAVESVFLNFIKIIYKYYLIIRLSCSINLSLLTILVFNFRFPAAI